MAPTKAHLRPRPIRVAYLVRESEHWDVMLDAVFAECYGRWAGRFTLIIPCDSGQISEGYLRWLEAYDPDLIYSYANLTPELVIQLHERLCPSYLTEHRFYNDDRNAYTYHPALPYQGLNPLTVFLEGGVIGPKPMSIVDCFPSQSAPSFLQESFGFYGRSLTPWPLPDEYKSFVESVSLVTPRMHEDKRLHPRPRGEYEIDRGLFLDKIAKNRNLFGLAQLSAYRSPRLEVRASDWSQTVNLVVGDSFTDGLIFWNARALLPAWLDDGVVTLKVLPSDLDDPSTFAGIREIIKHRIHVPHHNSNNSRIVLRSASISSEILECAVAKFRAVDTWNIYTQETLSSSESCVPSEEALKHASRDVDGSSSFRPRDWHEIAFSEAIFRPPSIVPRHIRSVSQLPGWFRQGMWALDLDIERSIDYSRFDNVQHRWRLPRRLRMAKAFSRGYQPGTHGPICKPRATIEGFLGLFSQVDGQLPEIHVPTDEMAFRFSLCDPPEWMPVRAGMEHLQTSISYDIRPSDKGRYLKALFRLSDGIHRGAETFLNRFWKSQFEFVRGNNNRKRQSPTGCGQSFA